MKTLPSNAGRIMFGLIFLVFEFFHFSSAEMMAGWLPSWMPVAKLMRYISGLGLIAGGDQTAMSMLLKDTGLLGAALYMSGHFKK